MESTEQNAFLFSANSSAALTVGPEEKLVLMSRLQHPILRNIASSKEDMSARQRCVNLLQTTVQDIMSTDRACDEDDDLVAATIDSALHSEMPSPLTNPNTRRPSLKRGSEAFDTLSSYSVCRKLKSQSAMLQNLCLASDGASCKVFWDLWDEVFVILAENVPLAKLKSAHEGRMFTPNNDAASYIESDTALRPSKYQCGSMSEECFPSRAASISSSIVSVQAEPVSPPIAYGYTPSFAAGFQDFETFEFESDHGGCKDLRQQLLAMDDSSLLPRFDNNHL